ncbi:Tyrosine-protein kinase [Fasciola hepatica]|uniref:Tyrosine-protein kinase n=1 Tax=Fasciola hepatica TaxID=6192 RepID=A0A4E0QVD8_FASHE|nr:Tyrosine-protein kinase [Fasciola hepatica]
MCCSDRSFRMLSADQELKVSRMTKRSQNKKLFGRDNYRLREFVLHTYCIRYFEVSGGNRGKEKGQLLLSHVKFIEKVQDDDMDSKKNVFQIAYAEDALSTSWYLLYIVANSAIERDDWISLVRFYTRERGAVFLPRYHPGVWKRPGRYSCCDDINRRSMGCQPTNEPGPPVVVEQLWRAVSAAEASNVPMQVSVSASSGVGPSQAVSAAQPPATYPVSLNQAVAAAVAAGVAVTVQLNTIPTASVVPAGATDLGTSGAAIPPGTHAVMLNAPAASIPLPAVLHSTTGISVPVPGVIMSTGISNAANITTSPQPFFQLHPQQQALMQQQQQQQQQKQLASLNSASTGNPTGPFAQPANAIRRSGHNQNRLHPVRYTQQTLFDMDDSENTVIAVHNYNPVRENQLPLQKGEKYYVVNQSNAQWWYVRNMAGQLGYVPTNYVHKPNSLNSFE